jgi:16S rRNA G966 N2-methylase RsmD
VFVEKSRAAVDVIRENLKSLGAEGRAEVFTAKALAVLERVSADIIFMDPPYEMENEYGAALSAIAKGLVIAQHASRMELLPAYGVLHCYRILKQGDNSLSFYRRLED